MGKIIETKQTIVKETDMTIPQEKINNLVTDVAVIKEQMINMKEQYANILISIEKLSVVPMETFLAAKEAAERDHKAIRDDIAEVGARVTKLEDAKNLKNTLLWVGLVASAIINIVGAAKIFGAL